MSDIENVRQRFWSPLEWVFVSLVSIIFMIAGCMWVITKHNEGILWWSIKGLIPGGRYSTSEMQKIVNQANLSASEVVGDLRIDYYSIGKDGAIEMHGTLLSWNRAVETDVLNNLRDQVKANMRKTLCTQGGATGAGPRQLFRVIYSSMDRTQSVQHTMRTNDC